MKHSPGPWSIGPEIQNGRFAGVTIKASATVAVVTSGCGSQEANARLIAAAPELLEALKSVCRDWEKIADKTPCWMPSISQARAAIEKAERS